MPPSTIEPGPSTQAFVGLGANLGDAPATLQSALMALAALPNTTLKHSSSVYCSAPIDSRGPDYLNAVAWLETRLDPHELLAELQRIEQAHGRERPYPNAPRTLDLDVLLYGEQYIHSATLTVPHPRLHERAFVVRPLAQIAPEVLVPGRGQAQDLLARVADQQADKLPR
ncbi:MAG: 2-amino-4-hydroxy-6-hydroxymethyldihydropteridine diphosphokinase [Burkholderiales bacterium]|nr:2-amino-4-hydroxy-6-hydroxymethyldihydropteridine diphosphokinase [Burkholderiales bacterium]